MLKLVQNVVFIDLSSELNTQQNLDENAEQAEFTGCPTIQT